MKGLLIKDLALLKGQKRFYLTVIILGFAMTFVTKSSFFAVGYIPFLMSMFSLNSISYDEHDNGNAFLFSLPITRRLYVIEKYLFTLLLCLASIALSLLFSVGAGFVLDELTLPFKIIPITLGSILIMYSLNIPIQLKFGSEKSRLITILLLMAFVACGYAISSIMANSGLDAVQIFNALSSISKTLIICASTLFVIAVCFVSMLISIGIMNKKEF